MSGENDLGEPVRPEWISKTYRSMWGLGPSEAMSLRDYALALERKLKMTEPSSVDTDYRCTKRPEWVWMWANYLTGKLDPSQEMCRDTARYALGLEQKIKDYDQRLFHSNSCRSQLMDEVEDLKNKLRDEHKQLPGEPGRPTWLNEKYRYTQLAKGLGQTQASQLCDYTLALERELKDARLKVGELSRRVGYLDKIIDLCAKADK